MSLMQPNTICIDFVIEFYVKNMETVLKCALATRTKHKAQGCCGRKETPSWPGGKTPSSTHMHLFSQATAGEHSLDVLPIYILPHAAVSAAPHVCARHSP